MVSVITAWVVQWVGLPHSPKTDSDCIMKKTIEGLDDCCMQLLIIMDSERNHSLGSPMDGTPPQSEE